MDHFHDICIYLLPLFILLLFGLGSLALLCLLLIASQQLYTALINVVSFWGASKEQQLDGGEDLSGRSENERHWWFWGIGTFNSEVCFEGRDPWKYEWGTLCSVNSIDDTNVKLLRSGPHFTKDFVLFWSCLDIFHLQLMFPLQKNRLFAPPSGVASQLGTIGPCLASGLRRGGEWGKHVRKGWWYDVMLYECCMD